MTTNAGTSVAPVAAMFLTPDELADLTGYVVPAYQVKWLDRAGYPFETNAAGRPKVLRAYVERRLGIGGEAPGTSADVPDFSRWAKA